VTRELSARWGVRVRVLPVTNDVIATEFDTEIGRLSFQEYFVRHHHGVRVNAVEVVGVDLARPTDEVLDAMTSAERIVIAPSNPIISIDPILQVRGVREILERRRDVVVAVSPIIDGAALKGPADRLLGELGHEVSSAGVVDFYRGLVGTWVIDEADRELEASLRERGVDVRVTTTIMARSEDARRLAAAVLA